MSAADPHGVTWKDIRRYAKAYKQGRIQQRWIDESIIIGHIPSLWCRYDKIPMPPFEYIGPALATLKPKVPWYKRWGKKRRKRKAMLQPSESYLSSDIMWKTAEENEERRQFKSPLASPALGRAMETARIASELNVSDEEAAKIYEWRVKHGVYDDN